jgi:hypothetical protein
MYIIVVDKTAIQWSITPVLFCNLSMFGEKATSIFRTKYETEQETSNKQTHRRAACLFPVSLVAYFSSMKMEAILSSGRSRDA